MLGLCPEVMFLFYVSLLSLFQVFSSPGCICLPAPVITCPPWCATPVSKCLHCVYIHSPVALLPPPICRSIFTPVNPALIVTLIVLPIGLFPRPHLLPEPIPAHLPLGDLCPFADLVSACWFLYLCFQTTKDLFVTPCSLRTTRACQCLLISSVNSWMSHI